MSYNSKYTGEQVEGFLDQIANGEIGGGIEAETDPVFSASPAATITDTKIAEWNDNTEILSSINQDLSALTNAIEGKVDKVTGKGLSTEDFTSALKSKLEGLSNYDDTTLSNALTTLRSDFDKLVSGDTTTAIKTFNEVIAFLDGIQDSQDLSSIIASIEQQIAGKQDTISDLDTIRDGASKGATALQSIPEEYVTEDNLIWTKVEGEAGVRLKGTNGTATGNLAISAGDDKTASDGTIFTSAASGDHAVAFGYGNTCAGRTTLAQGLYNTVNGKDSVAFGQRNLVGGDQAFAAGQQNEVTTRLGVAIGYKNKATNTDSIAIGYQNTSGGSASVAMGDTCEANGTSSTAMGYKTKATGSYSSTFGQNTQATNSGEVAMGVYNKSTTSTDTSEQTSFSFGIGTSDTNRINALEIKKNGDVYVGDKLLSVEDFMTAEDLAAVATSGSYNDLVDTPTFKTINGESILGEGDIEISGGSGEVGPQGPQGEQGPKGEDGEDGVGIASVKQTTTSSADGGTNVVTVTLSNGTTSTFNVRNGSKGSNGTNGTNGKDGADGEDGSDGEDGATFTPSVDSAGNLSWTNNKGLANPATVNIKGPKGDAVEGAATEEYVNNAIANAITNVINASY